MKLTKQEFKYCNQFEGCLTEEEKRMGCIATDVNFWIKKKNAKTNRQSNTKKSP